MTFAAAILLSLCAPVIQSIFFGPDWFHVDS